MKDKKTQKTRTVKQPPPDSGAGGAYPVQEIPSDKVADSKGNVVGPAHTDPAEYGGN